MDNGQTPKKKYTATSDVSPSEQLIGDPSSRRYLAVVLGLRSVASLWEVGDRHPDMAKRLTLRKWVGSGDSYKSLMVQHAFDIEGPNVIFGGAIATEKGIRSKGMDVATAVLNGDNAFGKPSKFSSKGKPYHKVQLSDGTTDDVLQQDLVVYGWLSAELSGLWYSIQENEFTTASTKGDPPSEVFIDYMHDFLPDDMSGFKGRVLQEMLLDLSGHHVHLIGRPDVPDTHQRDLLTDNTAGLFREIGEGTWSAHPTASDVQKLFRITSDANTI